MEDDDAAEINLSNLSVEGLYNIVIKQNKRRRPALHRVLMSLYFGLDLTQN